MSTLGTDAAPVLRVEDLSVRYEPKLGAPVDAVKNVSLSVAPGEFVGLAGESGSGKTTLAQAVLKLLRRPGRVTHGRVHWGETDVTDLDDDAVRPMRWSYVSTVFQSSMNSLNPVVRVQKVFEDVIGEHTGGSREKAHERAAELFDLVSVDARFLRMYPHELSGGMRQRVNLALALALEPQLVLFDEPTTGLDVIVQKSILDKIRELQERERFGAVLITHDMGTLLEFADRVAVMYEGELVEDISAADAVAPASSGRGPQHPYSVHLVGSYAELLGRTVEGYEGATLEVPDEVSSEVHEHTEEARQARRILDVEHLSRRFTKRHGLRTTYVDAVDDVSFSLDEGEVTALVGQSGSGKSTIARVLTRIDVPSSGKVLYRPRDGGEALDVAHLSRKQAREYLHAVQYVFQDPYAALNPALTVGYSLTRPLQNFHGISNKEAVERAADLLEQVGLTPASRFLGRFPHELSGGQRQRVVIARALAPEPRLIVADEPIASLDVSIRAEILEVLQNLVKDRGVGMLYITHDLLSAQTLANHAIVLRDGKVVESGAARDVIDDPQQPYTRELLDAIPNPFEREGAA